MNVNNHTSSDLRYNIHALNMMLEKSSDFQIRELTLTNIDKQAAVLFIDEIVDSNAVQQYIIEPLLTSKLPLKMQVKMSAI